MNKHNVISVSFSDTNNNCKSCSEYVDRITTLLIEDFKEVFANIKIKENYAIWDILSELNEKFIFIFDEYFGFTDEEVIELSKRNKNVEFDELEKWYNGYLTARGTRIYKTRSVVKALQNGYCES